MPRGTERKAGIGSVLLLPEILTKPLRAKRFITNNRKDFSATISELDATYPTDLPEP